MESPTWQRYVRTLCTNAWDLDTDATIDLLTQLETLVVADEVSDLNVAHVLRGVGVTERSADMIAPSIRVAIIVT